MLEGMEGVSTYAADVDRAFWVVNIITLFLFAITIGTMLYFTYKYNVKRHPPKDAQNIEHYTPIEIAWTVIPTILLGIIFYYGLDSLRMQRTMPTQPDTLQVKVKAQKWSWSFEYENGKKSHELIVPLNRAVKLSMTAPLNDVIHSFYVPAFRTKEDIVPGQTTYLWFNATKEGKFDIQCAEYCGTRHSFMRSFVKVVDDTQFETWLNPKVIKVVPKGLTIMEQNGCLGCHSLKSQVLVGPALNDIYNTKVSLMVTDVKKESLRDVKYLKDAILEPDKEIVEGFYPGIMPAFKGVLSNEDINEIINYLKGKEPIAEKPKIDGKEIVQNNGCLGCHSIDGTPLVGPSFKNIFNRKVKILVNGKVKEVDSNAKYLKTAIIKPNIEIVEGFYPGIMPSFENVLKKEEINAVIEYLKTVK